MKKYRSGFFVIWHPRKTGSCLHPSKAMGLWRRLLDLIVLPALFLLVFGLTVSGDPAVAATEGDYNNFFGTGAGASNTGDYNCNSFFGGYAGYRNMTGAYNSFYGGYVGYENISGGNNSFFGAFAGRCNSSGIENSIFGASAGYSNTDGAFNCFFGQGAGYSNTSGSNNSFFGRGTGRSNTTGSDNSFFGYQVGFDNTTGHSNSFYGRNSGLLNTEGYYNSFFGFKAGYSNTVESNNTFVGYEADFSPGTNPVTNPVTNATAIGCRAYVSQSNSLVLGSIKGVNLATSNVNVGIGISAPARQLHLRGDNAVFRMDRSTDTAAFMLVRTNIAGTAVLKTFVVGANAYGSNDGEFVINDLGNAVGGPGVRRMTIDNYGDVAFAGSVTATGFYPSSSIALKTNVRTYGNALETVKRLRGVRFDWKGSGKPSVGLVAEEVEDVVPEVVAHGGNGGEATGLNYDSLVGVLVEAVKEQQAELDTLKMEQKEKLDNLKATQQMELASLKAEHRAEMDRLKAVVQKLEALSLERP